VLMQRQSAAGLRWSIGAGFFLGLAALTRVNGIIIVLALLTGLWVLARGRRLKTSALLIGTAVLVTVPWIVRDAIVFHTFVPASDESGYTLAGTYNDASRTNSSNPAAWLPNPGKPYTAILHRHDLNEVQMDSKLQAAAFHYIGKHPTYLARVGLWNTLRFLQVTGNSREQLGARETGVGPTFSNVSRVAFWALFVIACAAALAVPAIRSAPAAVWLVPVLLLLSLVFVNSSARYRTPIDPFLVLAAAALLARLTAVWLQGSERRRVVDVQPG
jgi:hypothetical protein